MPITKNQLRVESKLREYLSGGPVCIDEKLPSYHELANKTETSVTVIQAIIPRLVSEGILEVIPRIGTFLRKKPDGQADYPRGATALRFYIEESSATTSNIWKNISRRFEELHQGVYIEFTLCDSDIPRLKKPDILLLEYGNIEKGIGQRKLVPWATDDIWDVENRTPFSRAIHSGGLARSCLPILIGFQVIFTNNRAPKIDAVELSDLLARIGQNRGLGVVFYDYLYPLWSIGLGGDGIPDRHHEAMKYLEAIANSPAPTVVFPDDFESNSEMTMLSPLIESTCQYYLGSLWMERMIDRSLWSISQPLGNGPVVMGANCLVIPEGKNSEAAIQFARFVGSDEGQHILAQGECLLPSKTSALSKHRHVKLHDLICQRGWAKPCLSIDHQWNAKLELALSEMRKLRVHRSDVNRTMSAIRAVDGK